MADPEESIRRHARTMKGVPSDYDELLSRMGSSPLILIGEASHGTHEFYQERAVITRRLIEEKRFNAVAVEADWPDAYRVNRYVRAIGVIYRPETERASHYFETHLPDQFDVMIHIDATRALQPLEKSQPWIKGEAPETFPSAL